MAILDAKPHTALLQLAVPNVYSTLCRKRFLSRYSIFVLILVATITNSFHTTIHPLSNTSHVVESKDVANPTAETRDIPNPLNESPIRFGTRSPTPQKVNVPRQKPVRRHRPYHNKSPIEVLFSPFDYEYNTSINSQDSSGASCPEYYCSGTEACVQNPIDCPCPYAGDTKCFRGDWYVCHKGSSHLC